MTVSLCLKELETCLGNYEQLCVDSYSTMLNFALYQVIETLRHLIRLGRG